MIEIADFGLEISDCFMLKRQEMQLSDYHIQQFLK